MASLNDSLAKITKGTGIALGGTFASLFLGFISRPMIARYGTEADYGGYSLALVIISICTVIATLGLRQGVARSIAYAREKNDSEKGQKLIPASIQLALISGISLGIIVFLTSDIIAAKIFHDAALALPLKIEYREWDGCYRDAKNLALDMCTGDWTVMLDSDEMLTLEVACELREYLAALVKEEPPKSEEKEP